MPMSEQSTEVRLAVLEDRYAQTAEDIRQINQSMRKLEQDFAKRPSWAVATIIGVLTTFTGVLLTYVLTVNVNI